MLRSCLLLPSPNQCGLILHKQLKGKTMTTLIKRGWEPGDLLSRPNSFTQPIGEYSNKGKESFLSELERKLKLLFFSSRGFSLFPTGESSKNIIERPCWRMFPWRKSGWIFSRELPSYLRLFYQGSSGSTPAFRRCSSWVEGSHADVVKSPSPFDRLFHISERLWA